MPLHRAASVALLLAWASPALAQDAAAEVCLLRSTETLTARNKPHVFETELDCGATPTEAQDTLAKLVHNVMDTADALELTAREGYRVVGTAWRDSFTGRQILGVITLVKPGAVAAPATAAPATTAPVDDVDALPELEADEIDAGAVDDASEPIELE